MMDLLQMLYLWLKAGHVIFVIFWMAGLFMLPRQLIYMHAVAAGSPEQALWASRSATLSRVILGPSLVLVWLLGIALVVSSGVWREGWLHAKVLFVLGLSAYHGWMIGLSRKMAAGARPISERHLRLVNEIPGVAVALIVILVIVKPAFG